ncbi:GNAT family N-acetyltransferase [Nocardiopsis quinghaiensis]|uniref:GNAT family N-acetyltransferase n=1 Tax=Nocardiopsis quinghaiensis TaxID=464995 RepID=UPI00123BDA66|nr:GNAT family N-acetyltransferase [Nocardiopsis quinghaiensis]
MSVQIKSPELRGLSTPPTVRDLCPGYRVARWDSPAALSPPCRERLHHTLRDLAARAFGADHSGYWRTRVEAGFFDQIATLALILGPDGSPVGWGGYHRRRFASRRALYLDAAGVVPAHRRFGLSAALMTHFLAREILLHPLRRTYVVLRTRHPAVYAGWRKGLGAARVFPNEFRPLPARVRRIAGEAAEWLGDGPRLETDTLLVRDAYRMFDGEIYGTRPRSGHTPLDDYFSHQVGPKDAVLVVARTSAPVLARVTAARVLRARAQTMPVVGGRPVRGADPVDPVSGTAPSGAGPAGLMPGVRP